MAKDNDCESKSTDVQNCSNDPQHTPTLKDRQVIPPHNVQTDSLQTFFRSTNKAFLLRNLLWSDENLHDVQELVYNFAAQLVQRDGPISFAEITDRANKALCGDEPLFLTHLMRFLDAIVWSNRRLLVEKLSDGATSVSTTTSETQKIASSSSATQRTIPPQHTQAAPQLTTGLTLVAAEHQRDDVRAKVLELEKFEAESPEEARWLLLVEFAGATTDDVASYFSLPVRTVDIAVANAIIQIRKVQS